MRSQSWKPLTYAVVTILGTALVLAIAYGIVLLIDPGFSPVEHGRLLGAIGGLIAYVTVMGLIWLLRRYFGKSFGTFLDDPDKEITVLGPGVEKRCLRCGSRFAGHHNDFHNAGFCSRSCQQAFPKAPERFDAGSSFESNPRD